ncbi:MAG: DUF4394 domain-containing protein [Cyanosarcina radialis HA8281-LM2]|jgi:hypothetical protein|nr:DUF4394 domain-containing protein [Cyanosarcina radialis HA8281-LM2]
MRILSKAIAKKLATLTVVGAGSLCSLFASISPTFSQTLSPRLSCPGLPNNVSILTLSSDNTLYTYNPSVGFVNPRRINNGINGGNFIGIDFRPADGRLYGLTDTDQIYIIDPVMGGAKLVSILTTTFDGGFQSLMDFNPSVDRLRLIGSNDQNLAVNVDTGGVTAQTTLTYAPGDRNQGVNPSVTAGAYNNNFAGAPQTVLYNIDGEKDVLTIQNPTANGVNVTVGSLNFNAAPNAGLDIFSTPQGANAAVAVSDTTLYCINLTTGAATSVFPNTGRINTVPNVPNGGFIDVAISPVQLPAGPVFGSVAPTSGSPGTTVFIAGFNFNNSSVFFNGVKAQIQSETPTLLTVTVPQGATTGPITITTPAGTTTSSPGVFTVVPAAQTQQQ